MHNIKSKFMTLFILSALSPLIVSCMNIDKQVKDPILDSITSMEDKPPSWSALTITHFPTVIPRDCGDGQAKLYDECADQVNILESAISTANEENKNVLIVYGGEWCIWCHVLDNYFKGKFRTFDYEWRDNYGDIQTWSMREQVSSDEINDAKRLNEYVANNFVIAHIDNSYANGNEAIEMTGFDPENIYYYPFIVALNSKGKYVGNMEPTSAIKGFEIRESGGEEFRGYERSILLEQLKLLKSKAS